MTAAKGGPLVFDIRRFALDDGPGIRTTVFTKGCPLSCSWCHNPESQAPEPEMAFHLDRCIGCGECAGSCGEEAISSTPKSGFNRQLCTCCGACAEACPSLALTRIGVYYSPRELTEAVLADDIFYRASGGGVTFSGGEPTLHMDYLGECMAEIKKKNIHICLQTCGYFDLAEFRQKLLEPVDLLFFDLKLADNRAHKKYTGVSNRLILDNFYALSACAEIRIIPRTPLIPTVTDTGENLEKLEKIIAKAGFDRLVTLPYNPLGKKKREKYL